MSSTGITTIDVKKMNRRKVYELIYTSRSLSKQEISKRLHMSLTTVTQNLKSLEEAGLIMKNGACESTGGRRAQSFGIRRTARAAVGVDILKEQVQLTAVDLYGDIIARRALPIPFSNSDDYFEKLGAQIEGFAGSLYVPSSSVLGVGIALQGLISSDGSHVAFGEIMGCTGLTLDRFARRIGFPCRLEHDSKAAACASLRRRKDVKNAVVLILNRNLGGAVIMDGRLYQGSGMHGGSVEHLCIHPGGRDCYCGQKGCLEAYCSADSLKELSGEAPEDFFNALRAGDAGRRRLFDEYLKNLALAVSSLITLLDCDVTVTGYLSAFLTEEDMRALRDEVKALSPFPLTENALLLEEYDEAAPAVGAALYYIDAFLEQLT